MTTEQIVQAARRNGGRRFVVSWRYRDNGIMNQCKSLVHAGVMKEVWEGPGSNTFILQSDEVVERWVAKREALKERRKTHPNKITQYVKARKLASKLRQANAQDTQKGIR